MRGVHNEENPLAKEPPFWLIKISFACGRAADDELYAFETQGRPLFHNKWDHWPRGQSATPSFNPVPHESAAMGPTVFEVHHSQPVKNLLKLETIQLCAGA